MISDVHMWDYVLSPCEIKRYAGDRSFTPGNVLNWRKLEFQISERVVLEEAHFSQRLHGGSFVCPDDDGSMCCKSPRSVWKNVHFSTGTQYSSCETDNNKAKFECSNCLFQNNSVTFGGQDYMPNVWHSICATWDSKTGVAQLWLDGKPSVRKFVGSSSITEPIVILGQDQDSYGGSFEQRQSFIGMISDVHMWHYALSPCEIQHYVNGDFSPGNVLNWRRLEFQISGRVLVEEAQLFFS
ncbi:uncharacterized protein V6R79_021783 [Siganus canaliculatus]